MTFLTIWKKMIIRLFGPVAQIVEKSRQAESLTRKFVVGNGPDSLRYFHNGRSVTFEALQGDFEKERIIFPSVQMRWDDTGAILSDSEKRYVVQNVVEILNVRGVKVRMEK